MNNAALDYGNTPYLDSVRVDVQHLQKCAQLYGESHELATTTQYQGAHDLLQ
jgi:hypothetical protein